MYNHASGASMSQTDSTNETNIPVSFTQFVVSLVQSTMVHLGEAPSPETGSKALNLNLARDTIDVLTMLKEKTEGNRTEDETRMLNTLLHEIRTKFLTASGSYRRR
jgi:hypothetical protein